MDIPVEGQRQGQHVLEIPAHRREPVAVREPVRLQRDRDVRADAAESHRRPDAEQPPGLRPDRGGRHTF
ncbi:MAG: hypothetical protein J0H99_17305 [Rhodospirillales bacterium]|nr:hypothetical protein [Rhodospirillales bacterium]